MPLLVNLRHLEDGPRDYSGELSAEELELVDLDELVKPEGGVTYRLTASLEEGGLLVQGQASLRLQCVCARCLRPFQDLLELGDWARLLALEGEESAQPHNDLVDLTPSLREDILLEFPQQPLCEEGCKGLPPVSSSDSRALDGPGRSEARGSAWAVLDKLKIVE